VRIVCGLVTSVAALWSGRNLRRRLGGDYGWGDEAVRTASTGSREAKVRHLYDAYGPALLGYLRRLTRDYHGGEDLAQETMLRAFLHADRLWPDEAAQRGWLFRVARNLALTSFARPAVLVDLEAATQESVADPANHVVAYVDLARSLRRLSPAQRRVFYELFYRDRTVAEAASALRVSPSTVRTHLDFGLRRLRRDLPDL
jgi:RNA polymerase sigma-70 factor, ECF subfamily